MPENKSIFKNIVRKLRYRSVEFDVEPYRKWVEEINKVEVASLMDEQLQAMSRELISQARGGIPVNELLVKAYAVVREAAERILGMRPFDVQLIAGIAMHDRNMVEMQTGEGKTLAAVLPAYLNGLNGKGVHVLTFNDYLAQRDAEWMGPLYRFLGLTVGYVREGMTLEERKKAYSCDITYLTAKEAGFDYLKSFLCIKRDELVQRPFNFAVIDEADSILIDEARIPLVIAGDNASSVGDPVQMIAFVRRLKPQIDYDTDEYGRNVYLTDKGLNVAEEEFRCGNLYKEGNLPLLVALQNALHAEVLLKRDVDYIVSKGKIQLVDEFTGRIADKRHWPHGLQEAIEAKEGLVLQDKGQILASVTLQNFVRLYPRICGMTGTAVPAADEFMEFYGLQVVVVPTNRPCIRKDEPDFIFTHKEAKYKALVAEISRVNATGRPILIGTCSVEESEMLAKRLMDAGISCNVLNARNDELEAKIVAQAGMLGAVTVSTNMAGRGTDIKLGGEAGEDYDKIISLGGLYVIGTSRHESLRVDKQLRGRAGRQGDRGSTRFFISLEDDLLVRFRLKELIPSKFYPRQQDGELDNPIIRKEILNAQKIIEGQNFDIRRTLTKYSIILERQRLAIYQWRRDIMEDISLPGFIAAMLGDGYQEACGRIGEEGLRKAEKQVCMHFINKCWADYLDYMSYIKQSIYLVNLGGKIPLDEYNKTAVTAFERLKEDIRNEITGTLSRVEITRDGIDMEKEGLKAPTSTWTYLVNDRPEQIGLNPVCLNPMAAVVNFPLWLAVALYYRFFRKVEKVN